MFFKAVNFKGEINRDRLGEFIFQTQIIGNHGDKFAVCGLAASVVDRISEIRIEHIDIPAIPSDLDGMTNRAFNAR